jgi:hypothetical protein
MMTLDQLLTHLDLGEESNIEFKKAEGVFRKKYPTAVTILLSAE